jgi:phage protein U
MLYALGPLEFEVAPFNTHEVGRTHAADFASKDLLGRRKSHEFVGAGDERMSFSGKLFPHKLGGLDSLGVLNAIRDSGAPQMLMRGDGTPLGWFLVESVRERSSHLDAQGVGKLIEFDIELLRDDAPSAASYIANLFSLFG